VGLLDFLRGKKKKEPDVLYLLMYQPKGQRGWVPVERFTYAPEKEEVSSLMLEPGVYNLQKREGGRISGYAWKEPHTVAGEGAERVVAEKVEGESDRVARAIEDDMVRAARWFKLPALIQSAIRQAMGDDNPLHGVAGGGESIKVKTLKEQLHELRGEYEDLHSIFGSTTDTQTKKIPVKGEIPAWLVYLPEVADQVGDTVEKRLNKWGLIGETVSKKKLLSMPEKPLKTKRLDLKAIKKKIGEKVSEGAGEQGKE